MIKIRRVCAVAALTGLLIAVVSGSGLAHVVVQVGPYAVAYGWQHEPTYVGEQNAVQVFLRDADGNPVDDLSADDLVVVVGTGGQTSDPLALEPTFDEDTGLGTPGEYVAAIVPTAPGDYTFHVTGSIHDQPIDETATSGESTFDSVVDPTAIQFPAKVPTSAEVVTRIDQIEGRLDGAQAPAAAAAATASQAVADASRALLVGSALAIVAIILALLALVLVVRQRRTARA